MSATNPRSCPLFVGASEPGRCDACDQPLAGRQRRWCSQTCARWFGDNHWWSFARHAALAGTLERCERCGRGPGETRTLELIRGYPISTWPLPPAGLRYGYGADHDPDEAAQYENARRWRRHLHAAGLEVNHRVPLRAWGVKHGTTGCWHHQENLELLCHGCHVTETRLQIVTTRAYAPGSATIACWEGGHHQCWAGPAAAAGAALHVACQCGCHAWGTVRAEAQPESQRRLFQEAI